MKATWNNETIAESNHTIMIEGNHYFPRADVKADMLRESDTHSRCPWKGTASYYTIVAGGMENVDAAWYYPAPTDAAIEIKDYIAFWKGVQLTP